MVWLWPNNLFASIKKQISFGSIPSGGRKRCKSPLPTYQMWEGKGWTMWLHWSILKIMVLEAVIAKDPFPKWLYYKGAIFHCLAWWKLPPLKWSLNKVCSFMMNLPSQIYLFSLAKEKQIFNLLDDQKQKPNRELCRPTRLRHYLTHLIFGQYLQQKW